jgi:acetoacetyl-CoA synthetase
MDAKIVPVWTPDAQRVAGARLTRFIEAVSYEYNLDIDDYQALHSWSVASPEEFWPAVVWFTGLEMTRSWDAVLTNGDLMPGASWFAGARLNFADNLLKRRDDSAAIIFRDETGRRRELSFAGLYTQVAGIARGLKAAGIRPGDRVAGLMPNQPETVIAMLGAASIGAVWSSCSPDFGVQGVLDRFGQISPRLLFAADGYHYGGKRFDSLSVIGELVNKIKTVERVVIVPFADAQPVIERIPGAVLWEDFKMPGEDRIKFESLPFNAPLYIVYSSGTTGVPKCIVHSAGGTLLQHLKEHVLHIDLDRDDRFFYYTTCGWMMWNWLVSGLATGAAIVLYDGSPFYPDADVLWHLAAEERVTVFGSSAKYLSAVEKSGLKPAERVRLDDLRTILSTGSPLAPSAYDFVYASVKSDVQLASISGGTDLIGCLASANPIGPVYRGELQCAALGMAVDVFGDDGQALGPAEKGELVCTRPFPTQPVGFWNDDDGSRYRAAYYERFPNVWAQGDYAEKTVHHGLVIYGRSDAVLNPGGVRIGTAEIYRQVEKIPSVLESLAIGQDWQGDTRIVLFVVLRTGVELNQELEDDIRATVRANTTPRHVPAKIIAVPEIPRTRSGKIVELAVRAVVHGEPVKNIEALANPAALEYFRGLAALQV